MTPELLFFLAGVSTVHAAQMADENGLCLKVEELGIRKGNTYLCEDPDLPLCCQTDDTFKCCESEEEKTVNDQVMLWGFVCLTILAFGFAACLLTRQGDICESETLRLAASNMAGTLGMKTLAEKVKKPRGEKNGGFNDIARKGPGGESRQSSRSELQKMPLAWF